MEANHGPSNTSISSPGGAAAAAVAAAPPITDDLGPLPSGWQMSKTESDRLFFIDHINKRTTWVCWIEQRREFRHTNMILPFKVDPRTGKPSPQPAAQREVQQNGALPVRERWDRCIIQHRPFLSLNRITGKCERCLTAEFIILIIVRIYQRVESANETRFSLSVTKTTTWTDPRVAGPVCCSRERRVWLPSPIDFDVYRIKYDAMTERKPRRILWVRSISLVICIDVSSVYSRAVVYRSDSSMLVRVLLRRHRSDLFVAIEKPLPILEQMSIELIILRLFLIHVIMKRNIDCFAVIYLDRKAKLAIKSNCTSIERMSWKHRFELWWVSKMPKSWKQGQYIHFQRNIYDRFTCF